MERDLKVKIGVWKKEERRKTIHDYYRIVEKEVVIVVGVVGIVVAVQQHIKSVLKCN